MKKYTTLLYICVLLFTVATPAIAQQKSILDKKLAISVYAEYNLYDIIRGKERDNKYYPASVDPVLDIRYAIHPNIGIGLNFSPHLKTFQTQIARYYDDYDLKDEEQFDVNYFTYGIKFHYAMSKIPTNYGPSVFLGYDQINTDLKNLHAEKEDLSRLYHSINIGLDDRKFFNSHTPLYIYYGFELNFLLNKYDNDEYYDGGYFEETLTDRILFNGTVGIGYLL